MWCPINMYSFYTFIKDQLKAYIWISLLNVECCKGLMCDRQACLPVNQIIISNGV